MTSIKNENFRPPPTPWFSYKKISFIWSCHKTLDPLSLNYGSHIWMTPKEDKICPTNPVLITDACYVARTVCGVSFWIDFCGFWWTSPDGKWRKNAQKSWPVTTFLRCWVFMTTNVSCSCKIFKQQPIKSISIPSSFTKIHPQ